MYFLRLIQKFLSMCNSTPKPEEVFTPRAAEVNPKMYVARPTHEDALKKALRGNLHIIIHGKSGTGKSWLYKKVFKDSDVFFEVANLANASRLGSIAAELKNIVDRQGEGAKKGYEIGGSVGGGPNYLKGKGSFVACYETGQMEPFEALLNFLRRKATSKGVVLVFDNLEAAFKENLLKELADLIILCDDERYSKYKVKILIVGVPGDIKEYYYKTPHYKTVANRLVELPEVARMELEECKMLIKKGLTERLRYSVSDVEKIVQHVSWITDRIPQMVHDYCLELAYLCEKEKTISMVDISKAELIWLSKSHYLTYTVIESNMNQRETKVGRRNQTLFALSLCDEEEFRVSTIESLLKSAFPQSTAGISLNIAQMMEQLSTSEHPIICRSPKGDSFVFEDPRYRMVLRTMLRKNSDETVERLLINNC